MLADLDSGPTRSGVACRAWLARTAPALTILALLVLAVGLGVQWIKRLSTDRPGVEASVTQAKASGAERPDSGLPTWLDRWIDLNDRYDEQSLSTGALAVLLGAAASLLVVFSRRLPTSSFLAAATGMAAMVVARADAGPRPVPEAIGAGGLVALSILQVALMTAAKPRAWKSGLGLLVGALNVVSDPAGIASTIALVLWFALRVVFDRLAWSSCRTNLVSTATLLSGGLVWIFAADHVEIAASTSAGSLAAAFAWPWAMPGWAPVIWSPAVFCLVRVLRGDARRAAMAPFAALAIVLAIAAGPRSVAHGDGGQVVLLFGLAVNVGCVALWWSTSRRSAESRLVLAAVWICTVFLGLMHGGAPREAIENTSPASSEAPVVGLWTAGNPGATGEWTSDWMRTEAPLLEAWVSGTLRPPETMATLRKGNGEEVSPWTEHVNAPDRWKRLNFPAPRDAFQLVVRDRSKDAWIAVTAPVEVGWVGWAVRQLGVAADAMIIAGAGLAALALVGIVAFAERVHAASIERGQPLFPWWLVPWLALAGGAIYALLNLDTTAGPNDSGGYLNSAKLIASGRIAADPQAIAGSEANARIFLPITFRTAPDGRIAPEYPVGLPLVIAAFAQVMPIERAVGAVVFLHLLLGIVLTRALAHDFGLPGGWAWFSAGIIGLSPVYLHQGLQPMSDVPALVWATAAVVFALRSRERPWLALVAGLATTLAVLVRPSNVLCVLPVVICLTGYWRQLVYWAAVGLPGALWLAWYQKSLYGDPFATGYGDPGSMFGLRFLLPTLGSYGRWLPELFTPVVLLVVAGPFLRSLAMRARFVLASWSLAFLAFYAVYWCTWDTWFNMRFVLPAAPAFVVLGVSTLREICARWRLTLFAAESYWRGVVPTALLVGAAVVALAASSVSRRVLFWVHCNREHAMAARWAGEHLPADAVVFAKHASGSLTFYTDLTILRSDHPHARSSEFMERVVATGRPIHAVTYHWETRGFRWEDGRLGSGYPDLPGSWERLAAFWDDHVFVWVRRYREGEDPDGGAE